MHISDTIEQLLENKIAFVAFRHPDAKEPQFMAGGEFISEKKLKKTPKAGFIFFPFHANEESPALIYEPEIEVSGWEATLPLNQLNPAQNANYSKTTKPYIATKTEYLKQAGQLIASLNHEKIDKVVLSRVLAHPFEHKPYWGKIFRKLCLTYPKAFVYLLSDGNGLFWMGATPETLLQVNQNQAYTMALAGTQAVKNTKSSTYQWPKKELEEQQYVVDYIHKLLRVSGVENPEISATSTQIAGKMAHLITHFDFKLPPQLSALGLAQKLHPTPAICGSPTSEALAMILNTENHNRAYYTGFLGSFKDKSNAHVFVNLRCMQVVDDMAYIYVGGGLTADSVAEKEWEETVLKSGTILSLFSK
ncbi:MAG: isochorismate synthase [Bacteroidetes bacterium]|jgi:isochorismate synthase|nr:isochorismate synthase [Bacteroidota bacterium]